MKLDQIILPFLGFNATGDLGPWTFYTTRRNGIVWFVKAPPLEPPSALQVHQRNLFRLVGYVWRSLQPEDRLRWQQAAVCAGLAITGYNLFTYYIAKRDPATIQTIENQTGLDLIPLEEMIP